MPSNKHSIISKKNRVNCMAALIFDVGVAVVIRKNDSILLVREATGRGR
tara:strand:+ start:5601 stop:5747 length:147 start_codon:yes stop_codon:yes gene_type:complete